MAVKEGSKSALVLIAASAACSALLGYVIPALLMTLCGTLVASNRGSCFGYEPSGDKTPICLGKPVDIEEGIDPAADEVTKEEKASLVDSDIVAEGTACPRSGRYGELSYVDLCHAMWEERHADTKHS